ncbi:RNA polymerase sigma-70 factor [Microlunatus speluncae]|uniref:RNA polymerase sigma-70 factor n=1 Tax=Microlunatus speluncae TaxID=2594267 RepID=UPI00126614B8|nr:RNA polymerase sigma-70 factor [Microlunatus speluncae]
MDQALYADYRPLIFSVAYHMLGSAADAEDVVQETFLRALQAPEIQHPKAYLTTIATRIAIDQLRSARVKRERYFGEWIPEPLLTEDGAWHAETKDALSLAVLTLLEQLTEAERAVFVLREVLDFPYQEIAKIIDKSEASCRQLLSRARKHVQADQPRFEVSPQRRAAVAEQFFRVFESGETAGLVQLLADDVVFHGDGGGNGWGIKSPVIGKLQVTRFLGGLLRQQDRLQVHLEPAEINGAPGALVRTADGALVNVISLDIVDGRIAAFRSVINHDKLRHLGPLADLDTLVP